RTHRQLRDRGGVLRRRPLSAPVHWQDAFTATTQRNPSRPAFRLDGPILRSEEVFPMGQWITLTTSRGPVAAWQAEPAGTPRGSLIVIQEVFGVTGHIRGVAEQYAGEGYLAIAPALFDLVEPGLELPYDETGVKRGLEIAGLVGFDAAVAVVDIAAHAART